MKLHNVLYSVSFVTGIIGIAGLCGFIEKETGLVTSVVLIAICAISAVAGMKEDGVFRQKNRPR